MLFLYLSAFTGTGGIEKFNRAFMKALYEVAGGVSGKLLVLSAYDTTTDSRYLPEEVFKGFDKNRLLFSLKAIQSAAKADTIILGHINLALIGLCIKWLFPTTRVILIAHGIEVWNVKSPVQRLFLHKADQILAVSQYTRNRILATNPELQNEKIQVFYNTLDPFIPLPYHFTKPAYLQKRYGLASSARIILTVARLSDSEQYKGYDKIIEELPAVLKACPDAIYLLCGKYGDGEKARIDGLIQQYNLLGKVIMPGFIPDLELIDHYLLADVFAMPSKKEGFGIVFIEALACGLSVIAGNKDGSAEALLHGKLGTLVDPDNNSDIRQALITRLLNDSTAAGKNALQQEVNTHFGFEAYTHRLQKIIHSYVYQFHGANL